MRILVGIPSLKPREEFLRDYVSLFDKCEHEVEIVWIRGRTLVDAQNALAEQLLATDADYLLLLEEDHWGHKAEMLGAMILANQPVVAIGYYSRWPGYPLTLMIDSGRPKPHQFVSIPLDVEMPVDLCGFGCTLIKREVIEGLESPVFRVNGHDSRGVATDINFCSRAIDSGFPVYGISTFNLVHDGIERSNVQGYRESWINSTAHLRPSIRDYITNTR